MRSDGGCSVCGGQRETNGRYCRKCRNAYQREHRKRQSAVNKRYEQALRKIADPNAEAAAMGIARAALGWFG